MPRKPREKSNSGVYHVMLRGINKQNIFFDTDDFQRMQWTLFEAQRKKLGEGQFSYDECQIYAYCIMNNHVHILLREGKLTVSQVMQKIEDRYAFIYNKKYDRMGHLFQGRFRSEPVDDLDYFHILLRYIHRNPVVGMECDVPEDYPHSSWREYLSSSSTTVAVILPNAFNIIDNYFERQELIEWVNMDVRDDCMDMDSERFVVSDNQAWSILSDISEEGNPEDFKCYPLDFQLECVKEAIRRGISINQASRLSALTVHTIRKCVNSKTKEEPTSDNDSGDVISQYFSIINNIHDISERMAQKMKCVIELIQETIFVDCKMVGEKLVISDSYARKVLKQMVEHDILFKDGNTKGARYLLKVCSGYSNEGSDPSFEKRSE